MKTKEEIKAMVKIIAAELERLPPEDVFGDSNANDIDELLTWKKSLESENPTNRDVTDWIKGEWSPLNDLV